MEKIKSILKLVFLKLIRLYQKYLSFDHGIFSYKYPNGFCRFHPTCSEYSHRAINKYGPFKGAFLGIKRVLRCNPFSKGGIDPLK